MRTLRCTAAAAVVVACFASFAAHADWFAAAYAGGGSAPKADVDASIPDLHVTATHRGVAFDSAVAYGARVGYWLERYPSVGFALDASRLAGPDEREQLSP